MSRSAWFVPLVLLTTGWHCRPRDTGDTEEEGPLAWYSTCGDPVCSGYSGPFPGIPPCTGEAEGDRCASVAGMPGTDGTAPSGSVRVSVRPWAS